MAETFCPVLSADPAVIFANGGYAQFMDMAPRTFNQAVSLTNSLSAVPITPTDFNVSFDFDGQMTPFVRPEKPALDPDRLVFSPPAAPGSAPAFTPGSVIMDAMPVFDLADPVLQHGRMPDAPALVAPLPPARPDDLVLPTAPSFTLPALPSLMELNLPALPNVQLPEFTGEKPLFVEPVINENWAFSPAQYASALLPKIQDKVRAMMDGGLGLEPVEQAMFDRGRERIDIEVRRDIDTRTDEFGSRGFTEPNGILSRAVSQIIQSGMNRKAEFSRDVSIKAFEESLANVRFAVQQGIALEQAAVTLHIQEQTLALQAAQFARETAIAILNARISVFNAKLQAYQTDAAVLRDRIQAELAKVELFRAQIEGEKARGEINMQRVQVYAEQVRTLGVLADFYTAQVNAVKVKSDVHKNAIEAFKAEVDAYSARWRGYGEEVQAYKAGVDAESARVTVHGNLVKAFADRVGAVNAMNRGKIDAEQLRIQQHGQQIQVFDAGMRRLLAMIQAEQARVSAEAQRASAVAQVYTAEAGVETAASAAADRSLQVGLEAARARTDVALEQAKTRVQENIALTQTALESVKTQAQVLSQLAASALSAMNFSASVSSSRSQSTGCSTSFSWNGEVADYN